MMIYLIKSGICLGLILAVYHLFLEKEKMHKFNRFYLLFGLIFSIAAPLVTVGYSTEILGAYTFLEPIENVGLAATDNLLSESENTFGLELNVVLKIIYLIAFSFFITQFSVKLFTLAKAIFRYKKVAYQNARLVLLAEDCLPHTFLSFIFVSRTAYEKETIEEELFIHELAHARQRHSIDVLIVEFLKTIFWFNPILIFYKRAIQLNHEFLADDAVIKTHRQVSDYQHLLLDKAANNKRIYLASNLNFLLTKKRLKMMTKNTSRFKVNALATMTIPLFVCMLLLFGNKVVAQKTISEKEKKEASDIESIKNAYFKDATFVIKESKNKKIYKKYEDLTDEEKAVIPPPPPPPPTTDGTPWKITPLEKGTLVHYEMKGKNMRVWIDQSGETVPPPPPPPPPPAPPAPPKAVKTTKAPKAVKPPKPPKAPKPVKPLDRTGNQ